MKLEGAGAGGRHLGMLKKAGCGENPEGLVASAYFLDYRRLFDQI